MNYDVGDKERVKKSAELDLVQSEDKFVVRRMVEKPENPKGTRICPSFYFYSANHISEIGPFIEGKGANLDAPGHFASHIVDMSQRDPNLGLVYAYQVPKSVEMFDFGCWEDYKPFAEP